MGGRSRVRHRLPHTSGRSAASRRVARAGRHGRRHRRSQTGSLQAPVGDVDRRGPRRRAYRHHRQDAPFDGGRRVGCGTAHRAVRSPTRTRARRYSTRHAGGHSHPVGVRTDDPGRRGPDPSSPRDRPRHRPDRPPTAQRRKDPDGNGQTGGTRKGGTPPDRAPDLLQCRCHRAPQRIADRRRVGRRQTVEERHRNHGERRDPGHVRRSAAPLPDRERRAPRQAAGGGGAGVSQTRGGVTQGVQPGCVDLRPGAFRTPRSHRTPQRSPPGDERGQRGARRPRVRHASELGRARDADRLRQRRPSLHGDAAG